MAIDRKIDLVDYHQILFPKKGKWLLKHELRASEEEKVFFTVIPISIYHSWLKDFCFLSHIPHRAPDASYPSEGSDGQTTFEALKQLLLIYPKCLFSSWIRREEAITRYLSKISMVAQMAKKIDKIQPKCLTTQLSHKFRRETKS